MSTGDADAIAQVREHHPEATDPSAANDGARLDINEDTAELLKKLIASKAAPK